MGNIYPNRKSARMIASEFRKATGNKIDPAFVHWLADRDGHFNKYYYGKETYYASNLRSLVDASYHTLYPVFLKEKEQKKLEKKKPKVAGYNPDRDHEPLDRIEYPWEESKASRRIMEAVYKTFVPTTEWMAKKYQEMNQWLFGGKLMDCNFEVFTRGAGMEGGVLGWFCMEGENLKVNENSGRLYREIDKYNIVNASRDNFVELCKPKIKLNGNYSGTEHAFLEVLVHEMCHYYNYMDGFSPIQAHGKEFRQIAAIVSTRSDGMFTIQRLASAEQMNEMVLNDEMKARRAKRAISKKRRLENKKNTISALLFFQNNGEIGLITTTSQDLINEVIKYHKPRGEKVLVSNDPKIIRYLFARGYTDDKRLIKIKDEKGNVVDYSWRFYYMQNKPWFGELKAMFEESGEQMSVAQQPQPQPQPIVTPLRLIFSIRTSTGVFETECSSYAELRNKLQQRFPNMSYETIGKLMSNKANFKNVKENRMNTKSIIREVIEDFISNETDSDESIKITQDMNLGEFTPFEMQQ